MVVLRRVPQIMRAPTSTLPVMLARGELVMTLDQGTPSSARLLSPALHGV